MEVLIQVKIFFVVATVVDCVSFWGDARFWLFKKNILFASSFLESKVELLTVIILKIIVALKPYINTTPQKSLALETIPFIFHSLKGIKPTTLLSSLNILI
jgi:hypothetical protein